jgi:hypothetical protein
MEPNTNTVQKVLGLRASPSFELMRTLNNYGHGLVNCLDPVAVCHSVATCFVVELTQSLIWKKVHQRFYKNFVRPHSGSEILPARFAAYTRSSAKEMTRNVAKTRFVCLPLNSYRPHGALTTTTTSGFTATLRPSSLSNKLFLLPKSKIVQKDVDFNQEK